MAANLLGQNLNYGEMDLTFEVDLSSAAAVTATRGDMVTVSKTGTGTYSAVIKNTQGYKLVEVLGNGPSIRAAAIAGNVQTAQITSIVQGAVANSPDDITILFTTKTSAAAAADTTSAITVGVWLAIRVTKLVSPI